MTKAVHSLKLHGQELPHHKKNHFWYLGIGLLLVSLLILTLRSSDYTLALVVVAAGIAIFRLADVASVSRDVQLTERGVYWGDQFLPYHQLRAFWLAVVEGRSTLYLQPLGGRSILHLIVPTHRVGEVTDYLDQFLPWHDAKSEPLADRVSRWLRL